MHQKLLTFITAILVLVFTINACPDECTCSLYNLWVRCYRIKFKGFPRNIPTNTEKISYSFGNIGSINSYDLEGFSGLKELKLFGASITNLHADSFKKLTRLETLDLREIS